MLTARTPMKTNALALGLAALLLAAAPPAARSQDLGDAALDRMTSFVSNAAILGLPTTTTLFGDQLASNKLQGGGRVAFGLWLDPEHNVTAGGRFFGLGGDTSRFNQFSNGNPILARPFFDTTIGQQNALLTAFPGPLVVAGGRINAY